MIPSGLDEIIQKVHQTDLEIQAERLKRDQEARRILRAQAESPGLNISELLEKISGPTDAKAVVDMPLPVATEEPVNVPIRKGSFPPPPLTGNSSK